MEEFINEVESSLGTTQPNEEKPRAQEEELDLDKPLVIENIGFWAKKSDFLVEKTVKPTKVTKRGYRYVLYFVMDDEDRKLEISSQDAKKLTELLGTVVSNWHEQELTIKATEKTFSIKGESVQGYQLIFS